MAPRAYKYEGTVMIDGVSLCVRFVANIPRTKNNRVSIMKEPSERVIGIDPGRVGMISAVENLPDRNAKITRSSAGKHYHDSGMSAGLRQGVKWRKSMKDVDLLLQYCSCETINDEKLSTYMSILGDNQAWDRLWRKKLKNGVNKPLG